MKSLYIEFNNRILKHVKAPGEQGRIVSTAVALAVAGKALLPTSVVDNLDAFYVDQVFPMATQTISEMGENVIFGARNALEYTQVFWKMRYFAAHPTANNGFQFSWMLEGLAAKAILENADFGTLYQGGATLLSSEMNNFLNRYKKEILILSNELAMLFRMEKDEADND